MNEQEQFLMGLDTDQTKEVDVLDQPLNPEPAKVEDGGENEDGEDEGGVEGIKPKNRRERRLMRKLQEERESSIFLAGKLEAREEGRRSLSEENDYLKGIESIFGNSTTEGQLATDLLKKAFIANRDEAKRQAIEEMRAERQKEVEAERAAKRELDGFIDEIEDTYEVTLTEPQERAYFQLLQKMSPKDSEGNVTNYADPHAVWEVFQEKLKANKGTGNRAAKELSARSMVQSGATKDSTLNKDKEDAMERYLRENGIIN